MKYYKRAILLFLIFNFLIIVILGYIFFLQIYSYNYYLNRSINNYTRFENIESMRGVIVDENNIPIAITEIQTNILWKVWPYNLNEDDYVFKKFLEDTLGVAVDELIEKGKKSDLKYVLLKEDITFEDYALIFEKFPHNNRIVLKKKLKRIYPHKNLFCHIVGYLNKEKKSMYGLEKLYDHVLIGKNGMKKNTVTSSGQVLSSMFIFEPESGSTIKTTLNYLIQYGLDNCFPKEFSGCAIVINPLNGAIRGLYSYPNFNPEIFQGVISEEEWSALLQQNSLMNRVIQGQYPPGSIYKLLLALILLEENLIKENTQWMCNGFIEYKNKKYHCNKKSGHGIVSIRDGIAHSCNIPFFSAAMSQYISIDLIAKYADSFNLGKVSNVFENEKQGLIPTVFWKKKRFGLPWYLGENLSVFIGQGATMLTPLQMSQLIMGIMHGYVITPYILELDKKEKKFLPYKKENLQIIRNNMRLGVKIGSSRLLSSLKNWEIYAKTGTVQVCALSKKDSLVENNVHNMKLFNHHGVFACWAKYKNYDPLIIVFVIENNNSSKYTVEVVKNFLLYCQENIYK